MPFKTSSPNAFSLIELLISVAVIAVLALIGIPALQTVRERSVGARCVNNLKQIGTATFQYTMDNRNELPWKYYITETGDTGSGAYTGTWYYNLARYLNVPHTVLAHDGINEERVKLGTKEHRLTEPCVFTCPGHRDTESSLTWKPKPMTWPAEKPVSYAPPLEARGSNSPRGKQGTATHPSGIQYYPVFMTDIVSPARKIWISDSARNDVLNTSESRWNNTSEGWAYQGFSRHNKGGNALFYDGHVEWLALKTFTHPASGTSSKVNKVYFQPYLTKEDEDKL